jgi:dTMP kinase
VRGALLTFEGVEGSGKSTQAELLAAWLRERGVEVVLSREPGGTAIGERIRGVLLDVAGREMDGRTELFLYLASRNQHVREMILPALGRGAVVLLDRFADSSLAYQGGGRMLGERVVARLNKLATAGLRPELTILIDVAVDVGRRRKDGALLDRLESERVEFHQRVRESYLRLARRAPKRIRVVDGARPAEELQVEVRHLAGEVLARRGILER